MKEEQMIESTLAYAKNIQESPKGEIKKSLSGERDYPLISLKDLKTSAGTINDILCKINSKIHSAYWEGQGSVICFIPFGFVYETINILKEKGYTVYIADNAYGNIKISGWSDF